jgi:hypothetical protein
MKSRRKSDQDRIINAYITQAVYQMLAKRQRRIVIYPHKVDAPFFTSPQAAEASSSSVIQTDSCSHRQSIVRRSNLTLKQSLVDSPQLLLDSSLRSFSFITWPCIIPVSCAVISVPQFRYLVLSPSWSSKYLCKVVPRRSPGDVPLLTIASRGVFPPYVTYLLGLWGNGIDGLLILYLPESLAFISIL